MCFNSLRLVFGASCSAILVTALAVAGCQKAQRADEKPAVSNAMAAHNMTDVTVSQDRDKGTMTLGGSVQGDADKDQAQHLAQQAAPDYTVVNEIGVRPAEAPAAGAEAGALDKGIEDNFAAVVQSHESLRQQSIEATSKNQTVVLRGTVKTEAQKIQAGKLAKTVPNVQQVVNEIKVNPKKDATAQP
ncbi:MAG TPA: BON domain-containing protein [Terracidiphilus sp.]|nr:BON domain-containing protein [Terracidiphilus sp.]